MNEQEILELLNSVGQDVLDEMRGIIRLNGNIATGRLYNSLKVRGLKIGEDKYSLLLSMPFYGKFIDKGRKPTRSGAPQGSPTLFEEIKKWTRLKGIPEEAAWPITQKIHKEGFKPGGSLGNGQPFTSPYYRMLNTLEDYMADEFARVVIKELFKK